MVIAALFFDVLLFIVIGFRIRPLGGHPIDRSATAFFVVGTDNPVPIMFASHAKIANNEKFAGVQVKSLLVKRRGFISEEQIRKHLSLFVFRYDVLFNLLTVNKNRLCRKR